MAAMETDPIKREAIRAQALAIRAALRRTHARLTNLAQRVLAGNHALPLPAVQAMNNDLNDIRDASDALVALGGEAAPAEGNRIKLAIRNLRQQLLALVNASSGIDFEITRRQVHKLHAAWHEIRAACSQLFKPGEFFDGGSIEEDRATPEQEAIDESITVKHRPRAIGVPDA